MGGFAQFPAPLRGVGACGRVASAGLWGVSAQFPAPLEGVRGTSVEMVRDYFTSTKSPAALIAGVVEVPANA